MFDPKLMEVANELCQGCRENREFDNLDKLYDANAVSMEAAEMPGGDVPREFNGLAAIKQKHEMWARMNEVHSVSVDGPYFNGPDKFSAIFEMDVTHRASNERSQMKEVATYTVQNGKIVQEDFYYAPPQM